MEGAATDDTEEAAAATETALFTGRRDTVAVGAATAVAAGATLTGCPVKELSKTPALAIHLLYGTGVAVGCVEVVFVSGLNCTTRAGFSAPLLLAFLSALGGIVGVDSPSSLFVTAIAGASMAEDELQESLFSSVSAISFSAAVPSAFATGVGGLGALFFFVLGLATVSCRLNVSADATEALASSKLDDVEDDDIDDAVVTDDADVDEEV